MPGKSTFWVLSKQVKEISGFGKMKVPTHFKTREEATRYVRELNLKKGIYHPGYYVEERIGNQPVVPPSKKKEATEETE